MAVDQSTMFCLTHCYREQAPSHIRLVVVLRGHLMR